MRLFITLILFFFSQRSFAQHQNLISNAFKGKLIGLGFNRGGIGVDVETSKKIELNCTECINIGNVYLIASEWNMEPVNNNQNIDNRVVLINNIPVLFNNYSRVGMKKKVGSSSLDSYMYIHLKKIPFECLSEDSIEFIIPSQNPDHFVTGFYIVIECLNSNLEQTDYTIVLNSKSFNPNQVDYFENPLSLNPIDFAKDVGFAVNGHTMNFLNGDESKVTVNNSTVGYIAGIDASSSNYPTSGVRGHFIYKNGELFGLDDDTPDSTMYGSDALAEISDYLNNESSFNFNIQNIYPASNLDNFVVASIFSYTSTCEAFPVTVSTDTIICRNETVQLSASGGTQYLWQPSTDLSCVYCPNPIFTGDSSRFYTVRIWNNGSCSVVRPVKVNVRQLPVFSSITSTPSECNGATGKIISSANLSGETYSLNGGTPQNSGNFFNLAPGDYTLSVHELNGCTNDTVITVGSSISTNAFFTATPTQGAPPLWVNFTNQSTNASNYEWFLNGISQGNNFPTYLFDTTGNYTVTLVAWPENPSCSDSFELQIYVFDSLIVQVPNVFTPNNDQSNDLFGITTNSPVSVEYQLFNRWGNEMIAGKSSLGTVTPSGLTFTPLWDGNNATEGTYFYKLTVTAETPKGEQKRTLDGFFVLVR